MDDNNRTQPRSRRHRAEPDQPTASHKPWRGGLSKSYCDDCGRVWPCNGWNRIHGINKEAHRG